MPDNPPVPAPIPLPKTRVFAPHHAARVAAWVRDAQELAWLSPDSIPPLSVQQVLDWGGRGHRQFLLHVASEPAPIAYGELNDMPGTPGAVWLGHILLDPALRGRGVGLACVRALVMLAFDELAAQQIILVVVPDNDAAIGCYLRAGFVHRGDEWKTPTDGRPAYRLLRMTLDRDRFFRLCALGEYPSDLA